MYHKVSLLCRFISVANFRCLTITRMLQGKHPFPELRMTHRRNFWLLLLASAALLTPSFVTLGFAQGAGRLQLQKIFIERLE